MSMIQYNPYRSVLRNNDFNRLINGLFPRIEEQQEATDYGWSPAVDIKEEPGSYRLHADVPGIKAEDIDISLEGDILTISGERKFDNEAGKKAYKRTERVHGKFFRRFSLPDTADQSKIKASCKDGVLEVVINKQEKVLPRKISVSC